jgi:hypothetical protein
MKHLWCQKCGATENLSAWHTVNLCPSCKPKRVRKAQPYHPGIYRREREKRSGNPPHLAWIRKQACVLGLLSCRGQKVHAHHVRRDTGGGTALKPPDTATVPLCVSHHLEGHNKGWQTFEGKYGIDLRAASIFYAQKSPFVDTATDLDLTITPRPKGAINNAQK